MLKVGKDVSLNLEGILVFQIFQRESCQQKSGLETFHDQIDNLTLENMKLCKKQLETFNFRQFLIRKCEFTRPEKRKMIPETRLPNRTFKLLFTELFVLFGRRLT